MEVLSMKGCRNRWLVLACFILAACLLSSCSEDSVTCPAPKTCPNPTAALLGTWTLFESYTNGMPDQMITTVELGFEANDVLYMRLEGIDTLTWWWMADESHIIMADPDPMNMAPGMKFEYEFEADTLNMTSVNSDDDYYWRLYR
jgi:hypothetical protein